ncbi:penicillin-binding transpeptidase domain-containing protein [Cellulosilyticum ruminicola]|uniref:penicillin-binding transpeptidase domain-containing protein n=1 Tax=Cellulosilyticum ruminicola TaxID=425254 RepID=UPI00278C380D|nr:penicillin-binding transpeptidase domain-containing protein [Cellulosilyticum ruminicola]
MINTYKARQLIALRSQIYSHAYRKYEDVCLAKDISEETISYLNEYEDRFPNLVINLEEKRFYPLGNMMSNIIGYTSGLTQNQYENLKNQGYGLSDEVGQMGVEKSFEEVLKGKKGSATIEVDNMGRQRQKISEIPSEKGEDIYLTIDATLQQDVYKAVENRLKEALVLKLKSPQLYNVSGYDMLVALIKTHHLSFESSGKDTVHLNVLIKSVEEAYKQIDPLMRQKISEEEIVINKMAEAPHGEAFIHEVLLALNELGVLKFDKNEQTLVESEEKIDLDALFIKQLEEGTLTPGQMNIDPFNCVAAMVDIRSGEVLSLIDYPSYDNNQMSAQSNKYFEKLNTDPRSLLWQRSLKTLKAPGSTFKMITALAGLEEGVIKPETVIDDVGIYKEAGKPYPKCWYYTNTGKGHGPLDLKGAIGASCNYYFYEVAHRLDGEEDGINILSKYMKTLGLTESTGIELEELMPNPSVPDIVVENKIGQLLQQFASASQSKQKEMIANEIVEVNKSFNLADENIKDEMASTLYNQQLKIYVVPVLQETLKKHYDALLSEMTKQVKDYVVMHQKDLTKQLTREVIFNKNFGSRNESVYKAVCNLVEKGTAHTSDAAIEKVLDEIDTNTLLDAYENALLKTYRQLIRQDGKNEDAKQLEMQIKYLDDQEKEIRKKLLTKVRQNLLNVIVNNLLNGVELNWTEGITVRTAIGQGYNAFSPLQVLRYVAALANGKKLQPLTLIQGGNAGKEEVLGLSYENIKAVQEGMLTVTTGEEGTAKGQFDNLPFKIAAKTGTAEEGSHEHNYIVAFAPYEKPEVALIVAIYNADGLGRYSTLIANDMLSSYFGLQNQQESITLANTWME